MGFYMIWIFPILKNKEASYHGYHNIDLYSINEHFGSSFIYSFPICYLPLNDIRSIPF